MLTTCHVVSIFGFVRLSQLIKPDQFCAHGGLFHLCFAEMSTKCYMFSVEKLIMFGFNCWDMIVSLGYRIAHISMLWVHKNKVHGSL